MNRVRKEVQDHYNRPDIYRSIIEQLEKADVDLSSVKRKDLMGIDELHVRGAAVSEEMAEYLDLTGKQILDVGSGLGGPARLLADSYDCHVTGIDLTEEFVASANRLSSLLGLDGKCKFIQADACDLPFDDARFDVVWTQHAQMNIEDKEKLYTEIVRVLKPGGQFIYYDIFKLPNSEIQYPLPWSDTGTTSFLFAKNELHSILQNLGLKSEMLKDQTSAGIKFFEALKANAGQDKSMKPAMGDGLKDKLMNLLDHLKSGKLELESAVFQK